MANKNRSKNWTKEEENALADEVVKHHDIFNRKYDMKGLTSHKKQEILENITREVNKVGCNQRSTEQVQKKYHNMKTSGKSTHIHNQHSIKFVTEGGPANVKTMSDAEEKIVSTIATVSLEGIPGGFDLAESSSGKDLGLTLVQAQPLQLHDSYSLDTTSSSVQSGKEVQDILDAEDVHKVYDPDTPQSQVPQPSTKQPVSSPKTKRRKIFPEPRLSSQELLLKRQLELLEEQNRLTRERNLIEVERNKICSQILDQLKINNFSSLE